jgi:hypothetical protein
MPIIKFITFAANGINYIEAANRLISQAQSLNFFDQIYLYTINDLIADNQFWQSHSEFILKNNRGYGYWLWKPYIIKKTFELLSDGDILLYLDAGCEIDKNEKQYLIDLVKNLETNNNYLIIGTIGCDFVKNWCKIDLLLRLDINVNKYLDTVQHQAGANLYIINQTTRQFIDEWYNICCDYHMIDDSLSINKEVESFIEHRHDQSVFSLLTKKYNIFTKGLDEKCIKYIRNRTGISKLNN